MDSRDYRFKNKLTRFARAHETARNLEQAEALLQEGLRESQQQFPPDHPLALQFEKALAGFFYRRGRLKEADPILARIIPAYHRVLGTNHSIPFDSELTLAEIYNAQGRVQDALTIYAGLHSRWTALCNFPNLRNNCYLGARLFVQHRRFEDAKTMLVTIRKSFQETPARPQHFQRFLEFESLWAQVLEQEGKFDEAAKLHADLQAQWVKLFPDPSAISGVGAIARFFRDQRRYKEAKESFDPLARAVGASVLKSREEFELFLEATAATQGWPAAAELCRKDFHLFTNSIFTWRVKATVLLYAGDRDGYRKAAAHLLALTPDKIKPQDIQTILNTATLGFSALPIEHVQHYEMHLHTLKEQLSASSGVQLARFHRAIGAAQLRRARPAEALGHFEKGLASLEQSEHARLLILKALAQHRLGRTDEARATLAQADARSQTQLPPLPEYEGLLSHYQLYDIILRREAEAALEGRQALK